MDAFNKPAAPAQTPPESPSDALLKAITKTRRNLSFVDAVKRRDWTLATKLQEEGADIMHRDRAALKAMTGCDDAAAADLLEKTRVGGYPQAFGYTMIAAIKNGNRATFDHIMLKKPDDRLLNDALFTALREDKTDMADVLMKHLAPERYNDAVVFALMVHRPAEYDKLIARFPDMEDALMLFANACAINNIPAMEKSLAMVQAKAETITRFLRADDWFDGNRGMMVLRDVAMHVLDSGHLPSINGFIDAFDNSNLLPGYMIIAAAAGMAKEHPQVLPHLLDKMQVQAGFAAAIVASSAGPAKAEAARVIIDKYPDEAKKSAPALLRLLASAEAEQPFFDAMKDGLELPAEGKQRAAILAAALDAGHAKIAATVEQGMAFNAEEIKALQDARSLAAKCKAAEKTGDWHADNDTLFWDAMSDGKFDVAAAVPADKPLQPPTKWRVSYIVNSIVAKGDMDLLGKTLARTAWDDETTKAVVESCMQSPETLKQADLLQPLPRTLTDSDINRFVTPTDRGGEVLALLMERGYVLDDKTASYALTRALVQDCRETATYLLSQGVKLGAGLKDAHCNAIESGAGPATMDIAERWIARAAVKPMQQRDMVSAAYADCMVEMIRSVDAAFNPESLAALKDDKGNSVLEILGAHGRLSDILVPELWKDRNAESFIKSNTPPCYHAQCDFAGLTSGIAQIRLRERAAGLKFKLK
ncbi:MAG: hypothetical protein ACAH80_04505 [Alphaproteobacteria bacterium]